MSDAFKRFGRRPPRFKVQPRILIICEDSVSGLTYLREAAAHFRCHATVEVAHCGRTDPLGIVREAKARRRTGRFDKVYCAIDRDKHDYFNEALEEALAVPGVEVIASFPCYEFWLRLHFGFTRKPYQATPRLSAGDQVSKDLKTFVGMEKYDKGLSKGIFAYLLPKLEDARRHALKVLEVADQEGNLNPSTRLNELIDLFERLQEPQLIKQA